MKIRKAKQEDAIKMNNLKKKTFEKISAKHYPKKLVESYLKKQTPKKIIENQKKKDYFVMEDKGKIIGMASLSKEGILSSLYIKHDEIGKRYGKLFMEFLENYANKKKIKKIKLYSTIGARRFYKRIGYKRTKKKSYWELAGHKIPNYEMEKKMTS